MPTAKETAISNLLTRRKTVKAQYDALLAEPASYSISGSVSATNRNLTELKEELASIDADLRALLNGGSPLVTRRYPNYSREND